MGRKKKKTEEEIEVPVKKPAIKKGAKKIIVAATLLVLALLMFLGFWGDGGIIGQKVDYGLSLVFGWGKFVIPFVFIYIAIFLFVKKRFTGHFWKYTGAVILFLSLLGIFHWFADNDQMATKAAEGQNGGWLGYFIAGTFIKYLGDVISLIALFAMALLGIFLIIGRSILFDSHQEDKDQEEQQTLVDSGAETTPMMQNQIEMDEKTIPEEEIKLKEDEIDANIKSIHFEETASEKGAGNFVESVREIGPRKPGTDEELDKDTLRRRYPDRKWNYPEYHLLKKSSELAKIDDSEGKSQMIKKTLKDFGIEVEDGEPPKTGPTVTQYSFKPAIGVKISRILALQDDIALALAKHPIRIEAPIPGKSLIGIEVPNDEPANVFLGNIFDQSDYIKRKSNLTICIGKDVNTEFIFDSLESMPHLLIAGSTGTGKSIAINSIITTLLYQNSPRDLNLILVDPKRVELSFFSGIPHVLGEVIVESKKVLNALKWAVSEMERRYKLLQETSSRDLISYREKQKTGGKRKYFDVEADKTIEEDMENLPSIVIVIDELAELMAGHGKEVEGAISRLAQMSRAVGIHLIVSTQRPSVEVITGLIKANITHRIAFRVASQIDSRTIMDRAGAEKLLGKGDLLYLSPQFMKPKRIQGPMITEKEVKAVVDSIKKNNNRDDFENLNGPDNSSIKDEFIQATNRDVSDEDEKDEAIYEQAKKEIIQAGRASTSFLQRRMRIGYGKAARILDMLEERGVIGPDRGGSKGREILIERDGKISPTVVDYENDLADQQKRDKWQI